MSNRYSIECALLQKFSKISIRHFAKMYFHAVFLLLLVTPLAYANNKCAPLNFGSGIVCRCNDTYCDTVEPNTRLPVGQAAQYKTTASGERLQKTILNWEDSKGIQVAPAVLLRINSSIKYQSIIGFGGAFTDTATSMILSLKAPAQEHLLRSYYSPDGIEYSTGRIPIASCDFSPSSYSYDDVDMDFDLQHFALHQEDLLHKIPVIQRAMKMGKRRINLFGSPWSAPGWMKNTGQMSGSGVMKGKAGDKYHKTWANYFVKFIEAYKSHGIPIWGITVQNELRNGFEMHYRFQVMGYTPTMEGDFVGMDLGPTLQASGNGDVKIMIYDDLRDFVSNWTDRCLANPEANKYVSGIAIHWYGDSPTNLQYLSMIHERHPDKFLFGSEACVLRPPLLGSWDRGESYASDIILDLNNWMSGWTDWNIAVNPNGGPSWANSYYESAVIVNTTSGEFYKQPLFYVMGHFSKFLPEGSQRIGLSEYGEQKGGLQYCAFLVPPDGIAVIIFNGGSEDVPMTVADDKGRMLHTTATAHSIITLSFTTP